MPHPFPSADGSSPPTRQFPDVPEMGIDPSKRYTATMDTSLGTIVIALDPSAAPNTVNNFVFLANYHYYDGVIFHRIINGFVCQGGDPTGTGRGGPGYRFEDETRDNPHRHQVGSLSMANAGPNTNGSQFFVTHIATDWLDGKHTVFGQVKSGQDVVNAIKQGDQLLKVTIEEK